MLDHLVRRRSGGSANSLSLGKVAERPEHANVNQDSSSENDRAQFYGSGSFGKALVRWVRKVEKPCEDPRTSLDQFFCIFPRAGPPPEKMGLGWVPGGYGTGAPGILGPMSAAFASICGSC